MKGIYKIINLVNNKVYIGSSYRLDRRVKEHFRYLRCNKHHSLHLQSAFNTYGASAFVTVILEVVDDESQLLDREQFWSDLYQCTDKRFGYNVRTIASTNRGNKIVITEETKRKISAALKGRCPSNIELLTKRERVHIILSINGVYHATYHNQREAARQTGVFYGTVSNQLRGISKTIKGFPGYVFSYSTNNTLQ